jgi:hypothetical protein
MHSDDVDKTGPVVILDDRPERTNPVTGSQLVLRLVKRVALIGILAGIGAVIPWLLTAPVSRHAVAFLVAFLGFSAFGLILYGTALLSDYSEKKRLASHYGFELRFGLNTTQSRAIRVRKPPEDLGSHVRRALEAVAPDIEMRELGASHVEGKLPRKRGRLQCRITAEVRHPRKDEALVVVHSELTEPFGFNDGGRNIINVEEFQLALRRLLEGESSSHRGGNRPASG